MNAPDPPPDAGQIDHVCDFFEAEWRLGRRPMIEPFLERVAPDRREELFRALLDLEIEYRIRHGEQPSLANYQERFPELAALIGDVLAESAPPTGPCLTLTITEGAHKGRAFTFADQEFLLAGRARTAHLLLDDELCAACHFLITIEPSACRLIDLGNRQGTAINGRSVQTADLRQGDVIQVGRTQLVVSLTGQSLPIASAILPTTTHYPAERMVSSNSIAEPMSLKGAAPLGPEALANKTILTTPAADSPGVIPLPSSFPLVPGYEIVRELGRGGMGVVYLARRLTDGMRVALKVIIPAVTAHPNQVERFLREVDIVRKLNNPQCEESVHIVHFLDSGAYDQGLFFAMEYVEGTDAARLVKQGPLSIRDALRILCQVLKGLAYAHAEGFVHRDVKPANILIDERGEKKIAKLADFGLARCYQESRISGLTIQGEFGGTLHFMPPEQITHFRRVKPAADQYSAAATLYNLLTARFLFKFDKDPASRLTQIQHEEPIPIRRHRPEVPEGLAVAIHRALAKEPSARFPHVLALRAALKPYGR